MVFPSYVCHLRTDKLPMADSRSADPSKARTLTQQREQNVSKHQGVFSLDWPTWLKLIEAYDLKQPLIPHRNDDGGQQVTAHGWYG